MKPRPSLACLFAVLIGIASPIVAEPLPLTDGVPRIAGPTEFRVALVAASSVELSWSDTLLDGADVDRYRLYDHERVVATLRDTRHRIDGISRDAMHYFSVSAVTTGGEETRRSVPLHVDLPPLAGDADGGNRQLPPLVNVHAEIVDTTTAVLRWDAAEPFWSPTEEGPYRYSVWIRHSLVAESEATSWSHDGFDPETPTWVAVGARSPANEGSGNLVYVLVDTSEPPGTRIEGYPGFGGVEDLSASVYSGTAAELFWDGGSAGPVYDLFVDGRLHARIGDDARSLFLDDLTPGTRTRLSIGSGWPYAGDDGRDGLLRHVWIETPPAPGGGSSDPTDPAAPAAPGSVTGLRAAVYGPSAAEVFWDRADAPLTTYRVSVDDGPAVSTDGVSRFLEGLAQGSDVTVAVAAVAPDGTIGEPVQVGFRTASAWIDPGPPGCTVSNLRVALYSATAAEFFWDRDPAGPRYAVTLDGRSLGLTRGTSWFGDGFAPGSEHEIGVVVEADDCTGAAATLRFRLPGG